MRYLTLVVIGCFIVSCWNGVDVDRFDIVTVTIVDTLGSDNSNVSLLFNQISDAWVCSNGYIAVLDRLSADLRLFNYNGDIVNSYGGYGLAPTELIVPISLGVLEDNYLRNGLR